jgi:hypothetical protein
VVLVLSELLFLYDAVVLFDSVVFDLIRYAPGRVGEEPDDKNALKNAFGCVEVLSLVLTLVPIVVLLCAQVFAVRRPDELLIGTCS